MSELATARERARLSGIPHYVFMSSRETWIAGAGARNNLWPDLHPVAGFDGTGARLADYAHDAHDACPIHEAAYRICGCP